MTYQPGELHAVAYDCQGQIVAEDRVVTASSQLHFEIEGPARIVGVDNGRQTM